MAEFIAYFDMRWTRMRLIYLAAIVLLVVGASGKESDDDGITFSDYTLYIGDYIDIGGYRAELVEIQSVRDGIIVMRVFKPGGGLDEQRAMLQNSPNSFDGGADEGGITLTSIDILDELSAKVRMEYQESLGSPRKRSSDRPRTSADQPNLIISKSFDKNDLAVGEDVKVTVSVKNAGSGAASQISVEDLPPLAEFSYIAGYPPKIKAELQPGESDSAVYVMNAVKEGSVTVPAIEVRYQDSKKNPKSNASAPFAVAINPRAKPDLKIFLSPSGAITEGGGGSLNVSISNLGRAPASRVEIQGSIRPAEGLAADGLDKSFFEIPPGSNENYTAALTGHKAGNYTVSLRASFLDKDAPQLREGKAEVVVKAREYKYLYFLLILPVVVIAIWMYKRYREYKY